MSVSWGYFDRFDSIMDRYLPVRGEGETKATQAVTALSKLIYKWYNDGDVYDNRYALEGWANDLSDYANWLYKYLPETQQVLDEISNYQTVRKNGDYESVILQPLADWLFDEDLLAELDQEPKVGSIYNCNGPYEFDESVGEEEDEEDEWYEEEDDEEDYY